jgi:mannose-binding lectin 2
MLFSQSWTGLCLLAGSLTGVMARKGGLIEDPNIKAISVCCQLQAIGTVTE